MVIKFGQQEGEMGINNLTWSQEKRKLSQLKPATYNPRKFNAEQYDQLKMSIDKFDLCDPLIINKNNTIISGHFRYKILKNKKVKEVDVRIPNRQLTEQEEKELNIRLNKNLGEFDLDLLKNFDDKLLKDIGFLEDELDTGDMDLEEKEELLIKPYKKVHFLISIPLDKIIEIQPIIKQIKALEGIEIEQSQN